MAQQWIAHSAHSALGAITAASPFSHVPHFASVSSLWPRPSTSITSSSTPTTTNQTNGFSTPTYFTRTTQATTNSSNHSRVVGTPIIQQDNNSSLFANSFLPTTRRSPSTVLNFGTNSLLSPELRSAFSSSSSSFTNATPSSFFDSSFRRDLSTFTVTHTSSPSHPVSAAASSPADEEAMFNDLSRAARIQSEDIENDSDNTLYDDLRMLNSDEVPATAPTSESSSQAMARKLANSILPPRPGTLTTPPSTVSRTKARSPSPKRRTPTVLDAIEMPASQLVFGFTSTDSELEQAARLAQHMQRQQRADDDEDEMEDDLEDEHREPLINEIVGWLTESNQVGARYKEKQRLMDMPHDAATFFADGRLRDLPNWTLLLRVCATKGLYEEGMQHWSTIRQIGLQPDMKTYVALITLCGTPSSDPQVNVERLNQAWQFLEEYKHHSSNHIDESLFNALATCAGKLADVDAAFKVLDAMKAHQVQPTHVIYTELINLCRKARTPESFARAEKLFNTMRKHGGLIEPDTMTYSVMIRTAGEAGSTDVAIALFDEMRSKQYAPDAYTYGALIHACSKSPHSYALTFEYFTDFLAQGFKPSVRIYNTLLHACARNSDVANALNLWSLMDQAGLKKDNISYNTMLNCIANSMKVDEVRRIIPKKTDEHSLIGPNGLMIEEKTDLKSLAREDKLDKEERIQMANLLFKQMKDTNVPVTLRTINALVKVMAVAGRLQRVLQLQSTLFETHPEFQMDFHSYQMIYSMYLEACRYNLALDQIATMHEAGLKGTRSMYTAMLRKLSKPHKKLTVAQLEEYGQRVLSYMKQDGIPIRAEDERLFNPDLYRQHIVQTEQARLRADTIKSGPAASYSQREDAMIRPSKNRTGSGRTGHQTQRFAEDPKLAIYKQKRIQREADAKDKMQGFKPKTKREQAEAIGHYFPTAQQIVKGRI